MKELISSGVKIDENSILTYASNPKRPGFQAHDRYEEYQVATTLEEYLEIADPKKAKADLAYDIEKGHLEVSQAELEDEPDPDTAEELEMEMRESSADDLAEME